MVEQLQAHDQLDLLYDMEQPLAVLAKDGKSQGSR